MEDTAVDWSRLQSSTSRYRSFRIREKLQHECIICKKVFSSKGDMLQHMDTHVAMDTDDESQHLTFECDVCRKRFLQKRYLLSHKTRCPSIKNVAKKAHNCTLCGKIFSRLSHLRRHQSHHLKQSSFVCTICDCAFVQQHHLERHFRSQCHQLKQKLLQGRLATEKASTSDNGESSAVSKIVRQRTTTVDTGRRNKCPFCPKGFATPWEMQRHWRLMHPYAVRRTRSSASTQQSHGTKTTFLLKCTRCGVRFDNDVFYQNHLEWHQGLRPYKCDKCSLAFPRRLEFENHQAAKHGLGWMFECVECGGKFAQRTQVDRHLKREHYPGSVSAMKLDPLSACRTEALRCKYCDEEALTVGQYRNHLANRHLRKVFVEEVPEPPSLPSTTSLYDVVQVDAVDQGAEQSRGTVELIVVIAPNSHPVRALRLGPLLPGWLLKIQPSYALLDIELDEEKPLMAGESIVLELPMPQPALLENIHSKTIRVSYAA